MANFPECQVWASRNDCVQIFVFLKLGLGLWLQTILLTKKLSCRTEKVDEKRTKPNHYKGGKKIETIDWIEDQLSPEAYLGWAKGLLIKYLCRYSHKNGLEDLVKAQYYMNKFIEKYSARIEKEKEVK